MPKTSFTPGPWHYQENSDAYTHIVRGKNDEFICSAPQDSSGRAEADMRRVAAMPELLEAPKKVEEALKKDSRGKTITGDSVEYHLDGQEMYHAINLARAVIARAEGGQS